jgi:hypothetical protein
LPFLAQKINALPLCVKLYFHEEILYADWKGKWSRKRKSLSCAIYCCKYMAPIQFQSVIDNCILINIVHYLMILIWQILVATFLNAY